MEAMCDWCGQVVPIGLDGMCFLGHPVSAAAVATASATHQEVDVHGQPAFDLDIAAPPEPLDTVPAVPDFATLPPPMVAPPLAVEQGPVPPALAPQGPAFAAASAPLPPQMPLMPPAPPPMPIPVASAPVAASPVAGPVMAVPAAPLPVPEPVGAATGAVAPATNPVDAAFAPLMSADVAAQAGPPPVSGPAPALPPQAPTGPGWQAVHIAEDVAVFEYRPPRAPTNGAVGAAAPPAPAPPLSPRAGLPTEQTPVVQPGPGAVQPPFAAGPPPGDPYHSVVSEEDVATFAPGDELDIPHSASRTRQIVLLAILAVVALGAGLAFVFGLI